MKHLMGPGGKVKGISQTLRRRIVGKCERKRKQHVILTNKSSQKTTTKKTKQKRQKAEEKNIINLRTFPGLKGIHLWPTGVKQHE